MKTVIVLLVLWITFQALDLPVMQVIAENVKLVVVSTFVLVVAYLFYRAKSKVAAYERK